MLRQTLPKAQVRRVAGLRDRSRARTCLGNPFGSPDPRMVESGPERRLYATRWSTFEQRPATDGQALDRQLGRIIPDVFVQHRERAAPGPAPAGVQQGLAVGLPKGRLYWHPAPRPEAVGGTSDGASGCA